VTDDRRATEGVLVVDKPVGPTSHDVVAMMRRTLGERRIGHTGTLDPAASGVLVLVIGRATRLVRFLAVDRKAYDAVVHLGVSTDTYDAQGEPLGEPHQGPLPSRAEVEAALASFVGTMLQRPPAFSAKKIGGERSYAVARRQVASGVQPEPPAAVAVSVHEIALVGYTDAAVSLRIACSDGFYVRSLAFDLGERLGTGAHLASLRRTRSGEFSLGDAHSLEALTSSREAARKAVTPLSGVLTGLPAITVTADGVRLIEHGRDVGPDACIEATERRPGRPGFVGGTGGSQPIRLLGPDGALLGIGSPTASGLLHPSVVLK